MKFVAFVFDCFDLQKQTGGPEQKTILKFLEKAEKSKSSLPIMHEKKLGKETDLQIKHGPYYADVDAVMKG